MISKKHIAMFEKTLYELADQEIRSSENNTEKKWLFIILKWLYENKCNIPEPLKEVEYIYADFDYPEEISSFVSYMPVKDNYDPSAHTTDENKTRLYKLWNDYLIETEKKIKLGIAF